MTDHRTLDRELDTLLRTRGARVDLVGAREILRGLAASPMAEDFAAALTLIAPDADDDLIAAIEDLNERIRDSLADDGLSATKTDPERLQKLRKEMKRRDIDAFIVPKADEHQGEFVARRAERLQWLTGFTGSAGSAVVFKSKKAAVFVDGRYTLQAKREVDGKLFERIHIADQSQSEWLAENLSDGKRLGYDPWLHTDAQRKALKQICKRAGATLVALSDNPIDVAWIGQPSAPVTPMVAHPKKYAGTTTAAKRAQIRAELERQDLDAVVLTTPDSIAWLLNVRGGDIPFTPVSLGFAIVHASSGIEMFLDPLKLSPGIDAHLGDEVVVLEPDTLADELAHLGHRNLRVGVDLSLAPAKIAMTLKDAGARVVNVTDPTQFPKACKNTVEQAGMRKAHIRDGAALATFLCWIDKVGGSGKVNEWDVGLYIDGLRKDLDLHRGPSFQTIAGFGANGAIVHYRAAEKTSAKLKKGSLLLVDSGGQYLDGTTDVTRTVAIGQPTAEMKDRFTRVLKGHIALARALFPAGVSGSQLDSLARKPLWDIGLDFDHGTGHGVGSYLAVHEGPQRISKAPSSVALQPGMVISNEPGYYKTRGYGIRIENLVMVTAPKKPKGGERALMGFETLTCAPFDLRLIDTKLLDTEEIAWVNTYHAWVAKTLKPLVDPDVRRWLVKATKAIKKGR